MNRIKVMTIFGTRPEAIKMAPVVLELARHPEIQPVCCVTAQHREMLDQVLELFSIVPDYDLDIMQARQSLSSIVVRALDRLDEVMEKEKPDITLVHGDTSTTFIGALSAFYHRSAVGHVEAGLRTWDKYSPYPEEINRRLVAPIADLHLCPTKKNYDNLLAENIKKGLYITGNTAIDTVLMLARDNYVFRNDALNHIDFENRRVIVMTAHRRENYGEPLRNIMRAVRRVVERYEDATVIYPMHLSPVVRETAREILGDTDRVRLIEPLAVDEMHNLIKRSYLVLTDSGGIQEEAPALGKPVLVLRTETERPEACEAGTAMLAGVDEEVIYTMTCRLFDDRSEYEKMSRAANPYGDGQASRRTVAAIKHHFGLGDRPDDFLPKR